MKEKKKINDKIINKYYTKNEKNRVNQNISESKIIETKIWTQKEAHSKLLGTGLNKETIKWDSCNTENILMEMVNYNDFIITVCRQMYNHL